MHISLEAHSLDRQTDCLGPGATIAPREVAAMVACIREAIAVHRPDVDKHHRIQLSGPVPEFNVIYGTDSSSCAQEMEAHWDNGRARS